MTLPLNVVPQVNLVPAQVSEEEKMVLVLE